MIKVNWQDHLDSNQSFVFAIGAKEDSSIENGFSNMRMNVLIIQYLLERLGD